MADVVCNGSPFGACSALKHNICVSVFEEDRVVRFTRIYFEVMAVYAEHLIIPGNRRY
jgi:hypothetical protein